MMILVCVLPVALTARFSIRLMSSGGLKQIAFVFSAILSFAYWCYTCITDIQPLQWKSFFGIAFCITTLHYRLVLRILPVMKKTGRKRGKDKKKKDKNMTTLRTPPPITMQLAEAVRAIGVTKTDLIVACLEAALPSVIAQKRAEREEALRGFAEPRHLKRTTN